MLSMFCKETGAVLPAGRLLCFGQSLFLVPEDMPELHGLKVLRPGLELGQVLKNRFEPAHAWALWLKTADSVADFPADSPEIAAYLRGETINVETCLLPGFGVNDVVGIRYGDYMAICVEKAWTMTMGIGGTMQHTLERVIINAE